MSVQDLLINNIGQCNEKHAGDVTTAETRGAWPKSRLGMGVGPLHANKPLPVQECKGALLCLTSCEVYCTVYTVWAFTDEDDYDSVRGSFFCCLRGVTRVGRSKHERTMKLKFSSRHGAR